MAITYTHEIEIPAYNALREAVGWRIVPEEMIRTGLAHTWFLVCAKDGEKTVGCLRVLGDGGFSMLIEDVMVLPAYQGQGIGKTMMGMAMAYLKDRTPEGARTKVDLLAAPNKESFYEPFGFEARPHAAQGAGMTMFVTKE